eukprot:scaffold8440_cov36-Tisochrysis_lutea.AAC.2
MAEAEEVIPNGSARLPNHLNAPSGLQVERAEPSGLVSRLLEAEAEEAADSPMLPGRIRELQMGHDPTGRTSPQGTMLLERKMQRQKEGHDAQTDEGTSVAQQQQWPVSNEETPRVADEADNAGSYASNSLLGRTSATHVQTRTGEDSPMLSGRLHQLMMGRDPTDETSPQGTRLLERKMQKQKAGHRDGQDEQHHDVLTSVAGYDAARQCETAHAPGFSRSGARPRPSPLDVSGASIDPGRVASPLGRTIPAHLQGLADTESPMLPGRLRQLQMGNDPTDTTSPQGTRLLGLKMQRQRDGHAADSHPPVMLCNNQAIPDDSTSSPMGAALLARRMERQHSMQREWPVSGLATDTPVPGECRVGELSTPPKLGER